MPGPLDYQMNMKSEGDFARRVLLRTVPELGLGVYLHQYEDLQAAVGVQCSKPASLSYHRSETIEVSIVCRQAPFSVTTLSSWVREIGFFQSKQYEHGSNSLISSTCARTREQLVDFSYCSPFVGV